MWCGVVWYQLIRQMPRNRHILWVGGNEWVPPTLGLVIIVSSYQPTTTQHTVAHRDTVQQHYKQTRAKLTMQSCNYLNLTVVSTGMTQNPAQQSLGRKVRQHGTVVSAKGWSHVAVIKSRSEGVLRYIGMIVIIHYCTMGDDVVDA